MAQRKQCFACDKWFTGKCNVNFCPNCMAELNDVKPNTTASDSIERQITDQANGGNVGSNRSKV